MNVGAFLTKAARLHPAKIALADGSLTLRYDEMEARAAAFAAGLRLRGYVPGDRIVLFMPNRADYLVALFALFKGGFVAAFLAAHPQFAQGDAAAELARAGIALDTGPTLKLLPHVHGCDGFFAAVLERAR